MKNFKEFITEKIDYEIKDGKIHISKANFRKVHKDYKNTKKGDERMMAFDPKTGGTVSYEVIFEEFMDEGFGKHSSKIDKKALMKQYRDNEDNNKHTENYLMLAKFFGTEKEVAKVKEIMKRSKKNGEVSEKDNDWMYKNINKYYTKLRRFLFT